MKKIGLIILTLALLAGLVPRTASATEITTFEQELTNYLDVVSSTRGFVVSEEDLSETLAGYGLTIDEFNTVDEIKTLLGVAITADLSNLDLIYEEYKLDQTTLTQLLLEYGEELNDYIFLNDLDMALNFYTDDGVINQEPNFESDLEAYLANVGSVRGFEVTKEDINAYLSTYSMSTADFESVEDLSDYLGDIIEADFSNLDFFSTNYDLTKENLLQLLEDKGKDINDMIYMDQIEEIVWDLDNSNAGMDSSALMNMLSQIGVTEAEIKNIENHFINNADYFSSEEVQTQLQDIAYRMMDFAEKIIAKGMNDENYKPTDAELSGFVSLYDEMLSVLKLKAVYILVNDGVETPISLSELLIMEDLNNAKLKIELYDTDSVLLADIMTTGEILTSQLSNVIPNANAAIVDKSVNETVKGGELPKTAGNYIQNIMAGLALIVLGILMYRKVRRKKSEILQK